LVTLSLSKRPQEYPAGR